MSNVFNDKVIFSEWFSKQEFIPFSFTPISNFSSHYIANQFVSLSESFVTSWDTTSGSLPIAQSTIASRPILASPTAIQFDGVGDVLTGSNWSNYITNSFTIQTCCQIVTYSVGSTVFSNSQIVADPNAYLGMSIWNAAGTQVRAWIADTIAAQYKNVFVNTTTESMVLTWTLHDGTMSIKKNLDVAQVLTGVNISPVAFDRVFKMAGGYGGNTANMKMFEFMSYKRLLTTDEINSNVMNMMTLWGVV